jgi:hypothetical protein
VAAGEREAASRRHHHRRPLPPPPSPLPRSREAGPDDAGNDDLEIELEEHAVGVNCTGPPPVEFPTD